MISGTTRAKRKHLPLLTDVPLYKLSIFHQDKSRFVTHMISYFFFNYIHLILIHCLSTCFCNQHPVNLLLHCFLCIFIEMITDNIDCLPDFLCKCVTLCFCIHHFFHNHFSFLLEPQQRVIPLVSVRTLFFKSGPKWALPVSQATYI